MVGPSGGGIELMFSVSITATSDQQRNRFCGKEGQKQVVGSRDSQKNKILSVLISPAKKKLPE